MFVRLSLWCLEWALGSDSASSWSIFTTLFFIQWHTIFISLNNKALPTSSLLLKNEHIIFQLRVKSYWKGRYVSDLSSSWMFPLLSQEVLWLSFDVPNKEGLFWARFSKLTMPVVNVSLKFQILISEIIQYFCWQNLRSLLLSFFSTKKSVHLVI